MLKNTLVAGIMSLGFIISAPAMAHNYHDSQTIYPANHYNHHQPVRHCLAGHRIDNRQANQRHRISSGARSGKLVGWEQAQLNKDQRRIRHEENRMRSDGCLTRDEARRLMSRLDRASHKIHALESNHVRRHTHRNHNYRNRHNRH